MILEGAFYKLPEILLVYTSSRSQYEATLANHLAMALLLELNARNVQMPQSRIHIEQPYPVTKTGAAYRADLYVDLSEVSTSLRLPQYGFKDRNWIEPSSTEVLAAEQTGLRRPRMWASWLETW